MGLSCHRMKTVCRLAAPGPTQRQSGHTTKLTTYLFKEDSGFPKHMPGFYKLLRPLTQRLVTLVHLDQP